jgi:hypothetical protein
MPIGSASRSFRSWARSSSSPWPWWCSWTTGLWARQRSPICSCGRSSLCRCAGNPPVDLSYGLYVYHWPAELILDAAGLTAAGRFVFTVTSIAAASLLAYASWRLVEAPALSQKNAAWIDTIPTRFNQRTRARNGVPKIDVD